MAVKVIQPNEVYEVKNISCLIYGQPSSSKTSIAQTTDTPITLAFDNLWYKAFGRKTIAMFDSWGDVINYDTSPYKTIVVDTVGKCLSLLSSALIKDNPKNGNRLGGLSLPGYGQLKEQFRQWVEGCKQHGQDLVFIAQEKAEKNGDDTYYCPDIIGGSYNTLMENCDIVGYLHHYNGKQVLDFSPSDRWMAKVPPCNWPQLQLPDFASSPTFLAGLIAEAKASMGQISAASAKIADDLGPWRSWLDKAPDLDATNANLSDLSSLDPVTKKQAWALITQYAKAHGWKFNRKANTFEAAKEEEVVTL